MCAQPISAGPARSMWPKRQRDFDFVQLAPRKRWYFGATHQSNRPSHEIMVLQNTRLEVHHFPPAVSYHIRAWGIHSAASGRPKCAAKVRFQPLPVTALYSGSPLPQTYLGERGWGVRGQIGRTKERGIMNGRSRSTRRSQRSLDAIAFARDQRGRASEFAHAVWQIVRNRRC